MKLSEVKRHAEMIEKFGIDGAIEMQGDAISFAQTVLGLLKIADVAVIYKDLNHVCMRLVENACPQCDLDRALKDLETE